MIDTVVRVASKKGGFFFFGMVGNYKTMFWRRAFIIIHPAILISTIFVVMVAIFEILSDSRDKSRMNP